MTVDTATALADWTAACFVALTSRIDLINAVTGVFPSDVPTNQPFPYISFGSKTESPFPVFGKPENRQIVQVIDIWSQQQADDEAIAILGIMNDILVGKVLAGAFFEHVVLYEQGTAVYDPVERVTQVPATYRAYSSTV